MTAPEESRLSATLIARGGADRLPDALASVAFADECVVVVEAASADRLEEVARRSGARVFVRPFEGFGRQKNAAASLATNRWILSLDADETVSPNLALEIRSRLATAASDTSPPAALRVPVRLAFFGRELLFGRDTVVRPARLYDRTRARFSDDPVGEEILAAGPIDSLEESILHRPHRDLADYLEKLDRHTTLAAEAKWAAGKKDTGFPAARVLWEFFDRAFLRLGFLDGTAGLAYAALSSATALLTHLKLRELELAIARGERRPPESARDEDAEALRVRALPGAR